MLFSGANVIDVTHVYKLIWVFKFRTTTEIVYTRIDATVRGTASIVSTGSLCSRRLQYFIEVAIWASASRQPFQAPIQEIIQRYNLDLKDYISLSKMRWLKSQLMFRSDQYIAMFFNVALVELCHWGTIPQVWYISWTFSTQINFIPFNNFHFCCMFPPSSPQSFEMVKWGKI